MNLPKLMTLPRRGRSSGQKCAQRGLLQNTCNSLSKPSPTGKVAREARRMRGLTGQDGRIKHLSNRSVIQHPSSTTASRRSPFPVGEGFSILQQPPRSFRAGALALVSRDRNLSKKELTNLFFYSIIPKLSVGSTNRAAYGEVA